MILSRTFLPVILFREASPTRTPWLYLLLRALVSSQIATSRCSSAPAVARQQS